MGKKKQKSEKTCQPTLDDALSLAKAELRKAAACYEKVRTQAAEKVENVRKINVGDVIDGTLEMVKRHPAAGLGVAALLGFFLGRMFRRK